MSDFLTFAFGIAFIELVRLAYDIYSTRPRPVAMIRNYRSIRVDCTIPRGHRIAP